jgi:hypothetical protein
MLQTGMPRLHNAGPIYRDNGPPFRYRIFHYDMVLLDHNLEQWRRGDQRICQRHRNSSLANHIPICIILRFTTTGLGGRVAIIRDVDFWISLLVGLQA